MVNENHFRFDRKIFFNFLKTIFLNRFQKLNSSSLHARLISDCRNSAMVGRQNPSGTGIREHSATEKLPASESDRIWMNPAGSGQNGRDLAGFGQNGWDPATDPAGAGQNGWDPAGSDRNQRSPIGIRQFWPDPAKSARRNQATTTVAFSPFVIFSYEPNAEKYF
jgi:hypothetical protein